MAKPNSIAKAAACRPGNSVIIQSRKCRQPADLKNLYPHKRELKERSTPSTSTSQPFYAYSNAMYSTSLLAFVGVSFIAAISGVQAGDWYNFYSSCNSPALQSGSNSVMQANCRKKNGVFVTTSLDLNRCLVNTNGKLGCKSNGKYAQSCSNCQIIGYTLHCNCNPGGQATQLDLNQCVGNNDGQLSC
ncbi:hypothetical protein CTheo_7127 [Ceratobasidium theobromae]|uniref:Cyanovirin-N domain-containing protein n=1 Tax=Ceratobasidium theobromae TaxID=1582974 RepID=A0A5N5QD28_9AGAM|nr:hypothetical protein CTheo_7127 [Ceratobasidium theobromae]